MQIIWLRLQSSGKLCELLPDDLESGEQLIKDLLLSVLNDYSWFIAIAEVTLHFSRFKNLYTLYICICCYDNFSALLGDIDHLQVTIEGLVEPVLLELLGEVFSLEYPDSI